MLIDNENMNTLIICQRGEVWQPLELTLRKRGYNLTINDHPEIAWIAYQEKFYPLVILDCRFSDTSCLKLCGQIRSLPQGDATMIIAITAEHEVFKLKKILDAGVDDYLIQSLQLADLELRLQVVEKQLRLRLPIRQLVNDLFLEKLERSSNFASNTLSKEPHYLILDKDFLILKKSVQAQQFADSPKAVEIGRDVRESFPEFFGLETKLEQILSNQEEVFFLPGIARVNQRNYHLYFDLSISHCVYQGQTCLMILFNDVSEKMILQQRLIQRVNETHILLKKLKDQEVYLETIIDSLTESLIIADARGIIQNINPATITLLGYDREELIGQSINFVIQDTNFVLPANLADIFREAELVCQQKKGGKIVVSFSCAVMNLDGELLFVYVGRDMTERHQTIKEIKNLNQSLQEKTRELEAFSHTVSHDLRTPLTHVKMFNSILREEYSQSLDQEGKDYLDQIDQACQRMEQLIKDLLHLSIVTTQDLNISPVNLTTLVAQIMSNLSKYNLQREITLKMPEEIVVNGDEKLLKIALENLLNNACKYTSKKETALIEFGVLENSGQTIYFISDNGAGFDMKYIDQLFQPFKRLHAQAEFQGTGIGLTTVQRIIQRHGGKIWAEAQENQGATFYFTIPKSDQD